MANRANGTTGLLQDFLIDQYTKKVNEFTSVDEFGEPVGDGMLNFLHAEFGEVVSEDDSPEEKLDAMRKIVSDAIDDLGNLLAGLDAGSGQVLRLIAAHKLADNISEAMPGEEAGAAPAPSGPSPM